MYVVKRGVYVEGECVCRGGVYVVKRGVYVVWRGVYVEGECVCRGGVCKLMCIHV